ncbi:hypothetical protein BH23ACT8_BH23ACT8_15730 [soil metagenome]
MTAHPITDAVFADEPSDNDDQPASHGERDDDKKKVSQATLLVELAQCCELWHDADGMAFATSPVDDHREHHPLRTRPFRTWLRRRFHAEHGKAPGGQALQDAIEVLDGQACFDGPEHPTAVRVAERDGAIWLDLADAAWRAVQITAAGWRVVADPPVRFRRRRGMDPLPAPESGGHLAELRRFVNISDEDWPLVAAFLAAAVRPTGPYPVLNIYGLQGSGKSSTTKMLRRLIDPNAADLRRLTRDERDLIIAATNGAMVVFENVSGLQPWQSDALAALATGTGYATRTLYENDEETIFSACRPIILNGISGLAARADLLDRSVLIELPDLVDTRPEKELWPAYYEARPRMLGALLSAAARGLERISGVSLIRPPRMADFAEWGVACEPGLGLDEGAFLVAYLRNRTAAQAAAMEESPVAAVVSDWIADVGAWTGTAGEAHAELTTDERRRSKTWPESGQAMASALKRATPALRASGVDVTYADGHRDARGRRLWTLTRSMRSSRGGTAGSAGVPDPPSDQRERPGTPPGTPGGPGSPPGTPGTPPTGTAGRETPSDQASGSPGSPGTRASTQSKSRPRAHAADPALEAELAEREARERGADGLFGVGLPDPEGSASHGATQPPAVVSPPGPCEVCGKNCVVTVAGRRVHAFCARGAA